MADPILTALAAASIIYSMPWSAALDRKHLEGPQLSIVQFQEFLKPATSHVGENNLRAKGDWACSVAPATILESAASSLKPGSTHTVMIWRPPGEHQLVEAHVNRAAHYLMLSIPRTATGFKITNGSEIYSTSLVLNPAKPVDEMALLLLPTRAKHLPTGLSAADSVEAAILDCLNPEEELSYRIVVRLLCRAHPDWIEKPRNRIP